VKLRTSKLLLLVWLLAGGFMLFAVDVTLHLLILWLSGLAALVWNRVDSRARGYRFSVTGPGGAGLSLSARGAGAGDE
jgi:hypothetical protein